MVGEHLWENIQKLISLSMSISYVSPVNINSSKHIVKLHENARNCCEVDLKGRVVWHGDEYFTITGTCPFYKSSLCIFPCACATAQRRNTNINNPSHAYLRYLVGLHHLWPIAIADLALSDYGDAHWSHHIRVAFTAIGGSVLLPTDSLEQDAIL